MIQAIPNCTQLVYSLSDPFTSFIEISMVLSKSYTLNVEYRTTLDFDGPVDHFIFKEIFCIKWSRLAEKFGPVFE